MKTPEQMADDYVNQTWFNLEYSTFGNTAKECKKAFESGYNSGHLAASNRVEELESLLRDIYSEVGSVGGKGTLQAADIRDRINLKLKPSQEKETPHENKNRNT